MTHNARRNPTRFAFHALRCRAEGGSMEAGSMGDIIYVPFLFTLVLIGLMLAMVGFYRIGSSYATQRSAQVGSVAPDQGEAFLRAIWEGWTGGNMPSGGFIVDGKSVNANIGAQTSFDMNLIGPYSFNVGAGGQLKVRSERFYPGQPECDEDTCDD